MSYTDRSNANNDLAIKSPVKAASTAPLTLSGEQTVDGVALVDGDRVLVMNQPSGIDNGIFIVRSGAWERAPDWDGNGDVVQGTIVLIANGTAHANELYKVSTANPIYIGTTAVTLTLIATVDSFDLATEGAAGVVELATQAETNAGTDDARAVTPLKLVTYVATQIPVAASETVAGKAELATQTETNTGTDDARIVTPLKLKTGLSNITVPTHGSATSRTLVSRFAERVNVKDFGAVGDGTTNDTAAIQNAVTYAAANRFGGYAVLYFPAGKYRVQSTAVTITSSSWKIFGDGRNATELVTDQNIPLISIDSHTAGSAVLRVSIADMAFLYDGSTSGSPALAPTSATGILVDCDTADTWGIRYCTFERLKFRQLYRGIRVEKTADDTTAGWNVSYHGFNNFFDIEVPNAGWDMANGIQIVGGMVHPLIMGCNLRGRTVGLDIGDLVQGHGDTIIVGNTFIDSDIGLRIRGPAAGSPVYRNSVCIIGNQFDSCVTNTFSLTNLAGVRVFANNHQAGVAYAISGVTNYTLNDDDDYVVNVTNGLLVGRVAADASGGSAVTGITLGIDGFIATTRSANIPLSVNRTTDDGTLVQLRQDGTAEGVISVAGVTVTYGAFLGSHWSQLEDGSKPDILKGTVCETVNALCEWPEDGRANDRLPKFKVSNTVASKNVYGVFLAWDNDPEVSTNDAFIASIGAGWVRIAPGVTVQIGDYLESNGDGCARVQADDVLRASTIGKVTSTEVIETYPDGSYLVCATLHCG